MERLYPADGIRYYDQPWAAVYYFEDGTKVGKPFFGPSRAAVQREAANFLRSEPAAYAAKVWDKSKAGGKVWWFVDDGQGWLTEEPWEVAA